MIRNSFILVLLLLISASCGQNEAPQRPEQPKQEFRPLIVEEENGKYTEWYPGHKQMKISGRKNAKGERAGIWRFYSEQGVELSVTVYTDGLKDGHIIVKHPNGALHYTGEYINDEPVGEWKFYNEKGELIETKLYPTE